MFGTHADVNMRISFFGSARPEIVKVLNELEARYGNCDISDAECVVAIGGDGTALRALHAATRAAGKPVFGMRVGNSRGYLANPVRLDGLEARLRVATRYSFHPLRIGMEDVTGLRRTLMSINDVSLVRRTRQAAKLLVAIDGTRYGAMFVGDGIVVATPLGSTAYNWSAGGPILPLQSGLLAITGIAPAYPAWAQIATEDNSVIELEVVTPAWRPTRLETDVEEASDIARATIALARDVVCTLMFDENPLLQARPSSEIARHGLNSRAADRLPRPPRG